MFSVYMLTVLHTKKVTYAVRHIMLAHYTYYYQYFSGRIQIKHVQYLQAWLQVVPDYLKIPQSQARIFCHENTHIFLSFSIFDLQDIKNYTFSFIKEVLNEVDHLQLNLMPGSPFLTQLRKYGCHDKLCIDLWWDKNQHVYYMTLYIMKWHSS